MLRSEILPQVPFRLCGQPALFSAESQGRPQAQLKPEGSMILRSAGAGKR